MKRTVLSIALVLLVSVAPARADAAWLIPPVDGPIGVHFDAPESKYAPGHRGIDYLLPEGTKVRAAADGVVTFAGPVAGARAVTIDHGGGLKTTYTSLAEISVIDGERVDAGRWIGTTSRAHLGITGLHFGVLLDGEYADPQLYFGPLDFAGAVHLTPIIGDDEPDVFGKKFRTAGSNERACIDPPEIGSDAPPPNRNIAVAIAGISSSTTQGKLPRIYGVHGPQMLGYEQDHIYHFSYRGTKGPELHEPYESGDTYGDLRAAAARLRDQLLEIARLHPGARVDLIAHSQGGIIARTFLEGMAEDWDGRLPVVEHLITFATPHRGAPLAGEVDDLESETLTGGLLLDGASALSETGLPLPDPHSAAVRQLEPGSELLDWLASEDVAFGTRVLALGMPNDLLVPADRALYPDKTSRVVPPSGWSGHSSIVASERARSLAYAFLRDAAPSCMGAWDTWGPRVGSVLGWVEGRTSWLYGTAENWLGGKLIRGVGRLAKLVWP